MSVSNKSQGKSGDPSDSAKSLFECPICFEDLKPPIITCENGHGICKTCNEKVTSCGLCRAKFSRNQNTLLNQVVESLVPKCKNWQNGCRYQGSYMNRHESKCDFKKSCTLVARKTALVTNVGNRKQPRTKSEVRCGEQSKTVKKSFPQPLPPFCVGAARKSAEVINEGNRTLQSRTKLEAMCGKQPKTVNELFPKPLPASRVGAERKPATIVTETKIEKAAKKAAARDDKKAAVREAQAEAKVLEAMAKAEGAKAKAEAAKAKAAAARAKAEQAKAKAKAEEMKAKAAAKQAVAEAKAVGARAKAEAAKARAKGVKAKADAGKQH